MESRSKPQSRNLVLTLLLTGFGIGVLSIWAEPLGLDITPGFGLMQIVGLLITATLLCAAGIIAIAVLNDRDTAAPVIDGQSMGGTQDVADHTKHTTDSDLLNWQGGVTQEILELETVTADLDRRAGWLWDDEAPPERAQH